MRSAASQVVWYVWNERPDVCGLFEVWPQQLSAMIAMCGPMSSRVHPGKINTWQVSLPCSGWLIPVCSRKKRQEWKDRTETMGRRTCGVCLSVRPPWQTAEVMFIDTHKLHTWWPYHALLPETHTHRYCTADRHRWRERETDKHWQVMEKIGLFYSLKLYFIYFQHCCQWFYNPSHAC